MRSRFLVIGLGQFGSGVARELARRGGDVIAIDIKQEVVDTVGPHVSRALCTDATRPDVIAELEPSETDAAICSIGAESVEANILVTALLKEHGAPRIITRTTGGLHARVVRRVGADEIINPEIEIARHVVHRVMLPRLEKTFEITEGISMAEIALPDSFAGKSLRDLDLRARFKVNLISIRRANSGVVLGAPGPDSVLEPGDKVLLVGALEDIERVSEVS